MNELGQWRYLIPLVLGVIVGLVWLREKNKTASRLSIWKRHRKKIPQSTRESKLDDLITEIENFINRWEQSKFPNSSYKSLMKMNGLVGRKKEIRQHAREIRRKIEPLQRLEIAKFQAPLDLAYWTANRMIALGIETEKIYQTVKGAEAYFLVNPDNLIQ